MSAVFSILFLLSLILFIWVLVAPQTLAKRSPKESSRKKSVPGLFIIVLILLILVGVTSPKQTPKKTVQLQTTKNSSNYTANPTVTEKTVTQTKPLPFSSTTTQDSSLAKGTTKITTPGVNGLETLTYEDTYSSGKQIAQKLLTSVVTTKPVTQVTAVGTYVAPTPAAATPTYGSSSTGSSVTIPSTTSGCTPLSDEGTCYEPGEYCRTSDYDVSGVAGDGEAITCEDNDGWRWEPS